jgi:hypothetical protein
MRTGVRAVAPALVALAAILNIANWYLTPERSGAWAISLAFIVFLLVPLWLARRLESRGLDAGWLWLGVVFASLMLSAGMGGKVAQAIGLIESQDMSRRITMALTGVFLAVIGNAMPKMLTPLSAHCDGAKTQAFNRFAGWTWFIAGLTHAMVWLVLPLDVAKPLSTMVILGAMFLVGRQLLRLWRTRREA